MLRVVLQLLKPTSGEVRFYHNRKPVKRLDVGYLPQKNMIDNRFPVTVEEVVAMGLPSVMKPLHRISAEERLLIDATLDTIGMTDKRNSPIGALSGGQLQRALLGRAMISHPEVLVLDEPLSYIDKEFERHLYGIIEQLARQSTIILVSHEMSVISGMESSAYTDPSGDSIIECTIDSLCTVTSIFSGGNENRYDASITSSALFASVALSIVIFLPIFHVGWLSASSTVILDISFLSLKGPPDAVIMSLSALCPLRRCHIALCSLSTGMMLMPFLSALSRRNRPPSTTDSLFARAMFMPISMRRSE